MQIFTVVSFQFSRAYKFQLSKNYYQILSIQQQSSKKIIRDAYLALAKKYHPDINPNEKGKFTLIQEAYNVLSNENLKKQYDQFKNGRSTSHSAKSNYRHDGEGYYSFYRKPSYQAKQNNYEAQFKGYTTMKNDPDMKVNIKKWTKQFYENYADKNTKNQKRQRKQAKTDIDIQYEKLQQMFSHKKYFKSKIQDKQDQDINENLKHLQKYWNKIKSKWLN